MNPWHPGSANPGPLNNFQQLSVAMNEITAAQSATPSDDSNMLPPSTPSTFPAPPSTTGGLSSSNSAVTSISCTKQMAAQQEGGAAMKDMAAAVCYLSHNMAPSTADISTTISLLVEHPELFKFDKLNIGDYFTKNHNRNQVAVFCTYDVELQK
ncbi:hypothetical protein PAXRUDRAFT_22711 [Paxillus rubicundulus Ve08.2h10]|uniref:Uncharacterized protein n=1 Tax=Paxillus rubicundulus Ve08.2h10 TaxID=930991 RepID=A0A0D0C8C2_9AGAM|nr:hypothetical protein PAXRUDRAFT_22711 [Paxillus rubicundulus Ve08.2h10]